MGVKRIKPNTIYNGDSLEVLKTLPDESINMVMTSPPYWALRDYGTADWEGGDPNCDHIANPSATKKFGNPEFNKNRPSREETKTAGYYEEICPKCGAKKVDKQIGLEPTFNDYINQLCNIFDEVKRVLRKDGTCWVNLGDTYSSQSSYSAKGRQGYEGKTCNMKSLMNKRFDKKSYGGKATNHDTTILGRGRNASAPEKSLCLIPFRFAIEMVNRGWILRNTIIWYKPNCMPSSVKDRFTVDFEYLFFFSKNKKYYFETQYEPVQQSSIERMGRKWGGSKHSKLGVHNNLQQEIEPEERMDKNRWLSEKGRNMRTVWKISPKPFREAHISRKTL